MGKNPAIVFTEPCKVAIEERAVPAPKADELFIKTHRTLISTGTELTILNGRFPRGSAWAKYGKFPFSPGYEPGHHSLTSEPLYTRDTCCRSVRACATEGTQQDMALTNCLLCLLFRPTIREGGIIR